MRVHTFVYLRALDTFIGHFARGRRVERAWLRLRREVLLSQENMDSNDDSDADEVRPAASVSGKRRHIKKHVVQEHAIDEEESGVESDSESDSSAPSKWKKQKATQVVNNYEDLSKADAIDKLDNSKLFFYFGIQFVITGAICANIKNEDSEEIQVSLSVLSGNKIPPAIIRLWHKHSSHWLLRKRKHIEFYDMKDNKPFKMCPVFKDFVATKLAVLVKAAHEVSSPSYSRTVLTQFYPGATVLKNIFVNPHRYKAVDTNAAQDWYLRERDIATVYHKLDTDIAANHAEELAAMSANRNAGRSVIDRGPQWDSHKEYLLKACGGKDGTTFALHTAALGLWVYTTQLDSWAHHVRGSKDAVGTIVLDLQRRFRHHFAMQVKN